MMKKLLLIVFAVIQNCGFSQAICGLYTNSEQRINFFHDSTIAFTIYNNCCLITVQKGKGEFLIKDDLLIVKTKHDETILQSNYKVIDNNDDSTMSKISIIEQNGEPIPYVSIGVRDKNDKFLRLSQSANNEGKVTFRGAPDCASVEFKYVGYGPLKIPYSIIKGKNVVIVMQRWYIIENETIVFYLQSQNAGQITLIGPLDKKYIRLIEQKKYKRFKSKMSKDYSCPQTRVLTKNNS